MSLLSDWKFLIVTVVALLGLAFASLNLSAQYANQQRQEEVAERQQFINESVQLSQLNTSFIQALAQLSAQTDDANLRRLLNEHGITFTVNPPTEEPGASTNE